MKLFRQIVRRDLFLSGRQVFSASVIVIALTLISSGCSLGLENLQAEAVIEASRTTQLTDLDDIEALKVVFNQDAGQPRIILLLSPT